MATVVQSYQPFPGGPTLVLEEDGGRYRALCRLAPPDNKQVESDWCPTRWEAKVQLRLILAQRLGRLKAEGE